MQAAVPVWTAAGYLEMSVEVLLNTYGHHQPDRLREAANAFGRQSPRNVSVALSVIGENARRQKMQKTNESVVGPAGLEPATRPL